MSGGGAILSLDDDPEDVSTELLLISKEKKAIPVSRDASRLSHLICATTERDPGCKEIDLFHIETPILKRVVEYMTYHLEVPPRNIEMPIKSNKMSDLVDEFDVKFTNTSQEVMFKTLLAANYMDIKPLLHLMCAKTASLMKGKTPDQIRATFNIRNDYTAEEEEMVRREHRDLIS